jgi:hypothetical protein
METSTTTRTTERRGAGDASAECCTECKCMQLCLHQVHAAVLASGAKVVLALHLGGGGAFVQKPREMASTVSTCLPPVGCICAPSSCV